MNLCGLKPKRRFYTSGLGELSEENLKVSNYAD